MTTNRKSLFFCVGLCFAIILGCLPASADTTNSIGQKPLSFVRDVLPVLSKAGCNAGKCHAKPEGQNGFKLSVFAYDPASDYEQIVRAARGRRVFPGAPEASLLLLKPTMAVNHGGGKKLEVDSPFYKLLVEWINQGMPYTLPGEASLTKVEITPKEGLYKNEQKQPLKLTAHYSDGSTRDVTHLADFSSSEKELLSVSEHGEFVTGNIHGEGVVVGRYMGLIDTSLVTVPSKQALSESLFTSLPIHNEIDKLVYAKLKKIGIAPSVQANDTDFLRRSSLDAIGKLPTPEQVQAFLASNESDRRKRWIASLLEDPAYADYWANKWSDLVRPNTLRVGVKSVYLLDIWLRESFRDNKPYNQFVRELLTAEGRSDDNGPAAIFRDRRNPVDAAAWVSQIFLGVRMECAKCHHHPNEKWSQADFYQVAAFFGSMKSKGRGVAPPINAGAELVYFSPGGKVKHPVTGEEMKPTALDAPPAVIDEQRDPREAWVDWMEQPNNPFFARAVVNRVWGNYFGRGIVDPVDDFRSSNLPVNEPLLAWLAKDFVEHGYDLKHLMRTIMESAVYQQSSIPNETNLGDNKQFSRSLRRRLPAEVMVDAVSDVTGEPQNLDGLPAESRALQVWNQRVDSEFMDAFGRPNQSADCPCERDSRTSLVQALHLMNSRDLQSKISSESGRVRKLADSKMTPEEIVTELYLATYSRKPDSDELATAASLFHAPDAKRRTVTEDVLWALLNSAEFVFNH
ncbi:MAG: DUF1549 and DUF1553 domain-containing protein [Verrucomicrobiales bacterium]